MTHLSHGPIPSCPVKDAELDITGQFFPFGCYIFRTKEDMASVQLELPFDAIGPNTGRID